MTGPGTIQIGSLPPGNDVYGAGKVVLVVGSIVTHIEPATARAVAVQLILEAEKAGLPPLSPDNRRRVA